MSERTSMHWTHRGARAQGLDGAPHVLPADVRRVGRMTSEGPALASAAGVPCLLRRTYKALTEPAPDGAYDFITYVECIDADVPTFREVVASRRDVTKNPEWEF